MTNSKTSSHIATPQDTAISAMVVNAQNGLECIVYETWGPPTQDDAVSHLSALNKQTNLTGLKAMNITNGFFEDIVSPFDRSQQKPKEHGLRTLADVDDFVLRMFLDD